MRTTHWAWARLSYIMRLWSIITNAIGHFRLGGRKFEFRRKPSFPKKVTEEFLLVDLMNNLDQLAEDEQSVVSRVKEKSERLNGKSLKHAAHEFGTVRTRKFFDTVIIKERQHAI